jgi:hypothetical protein
MMMTSDTTSARARRARLARFSAVYDRFWPPCKKTAKTVENGENRRRWL